MTPPKLWDMNQRREQYEIESDLRPIENWSSAEQYWEGYAKWLEWKLDNPVLLNLSSKQLDNLVSRIEALVKATHAKLWRMRKLSSYQKLKAENAGLKQDIYSLIEKSDQIEGMETKAMYQMEYGLYEMIWFGNPVLADQWT